MEQKKVTQAERRVLKALGRVDAYVHVDIWQSSMIEVRHKDEGLIISFRPVTLVTLVNKGLLSDVNTGHKLTALGGEAAIKGYYTPGGNAEKREKALSNLNVSGSDTGK